ncbi:MAG TPA: carbohydrate binding domain-containing protein [Elusimicrobiota bacterium]|nr:carbohydrate binding domain-containing protein [Elusimicrobiota bacterium]
MKKKWILLLVSVMALNGAFEGLSWAASKKKGAAKPAVEEVLDEEEAEMDAAPSAPAQSEAVLDSFEAVDWKAENGDGATISLVSAQGHRGKSLQIKYDLKKSNQWVQVHKPLSLPAMKDKALRFWIKGSGAVNNIEIKLVDADGSNFGYRMEKATGKADWQKVEIPYLDFGYWWGGDALLGEIKEVYLAITTADGGMGTVELDELAVVGSRVKAQEKGMIFDGESTAGWETSSAEGASVKLASVPGRTGQSFVLDYQFPANQWVAIRKAVKMSMTDDSVFVFYIKAEGAVNNLEFKIVDTDGSTFGYTFSELTQYKDWQEVSLVLKDMKYLWGNENGLDKERIAFVDIALSGNGGKGKAYLDDMELR